MKIYEKYPNLIAYQAWHTNFKRSPQQPTTISIMGNLLYTIAVILVILWLIGYFGFASFGLGNIIHILLVIAVVAVILRLIRGGRVL